MNDLKLEIPANPGHIFDRGPQEPHCLDQWTGEPGDMKKGKKHFLASGFAMSVFWLVCLCGCKPEEMLVTVNSSALKTAAEGGIGKAKVIVSYDLSSCEEPELPKKIKQAALPFLGDGATIELEKTVKKTIREGGDRDDEEEEVDEKLDDAKLVATFSIPVGVEDKLKESKSIVWLKYFPDKKTFALINGNSLSSLNTALYKVNDDVECEFAGEMAKIKIVCDVPVTIGVAAVKVEKESVLADTIIKSDGRITINFGEFYEKSAPCFTWGPIHELKPIAMSDSFKGDREKTSEWDW